MTRTPSVVLRSPCLWIGLLVVTLGLEWLLVRQFYVRELLDTYPRMYDQAAYLSRALDIYTEIREHGLWRGVTAALGWSAPQGQLVQLEMAIAFLIGGPGRLSALAINFLHFALLQLAFILLGRSEDRSVKGLAFAGLTASAALIVTDAGSLIDFRLDFAAFVMLCVVGCAVVRSRGFRLRGWSVTVGLLAGLLGLTRVISFLFVSIGAGLFAVLLLWPAWRNRWDARTRFVNLLLAGVAASVLMAPAIVAQWQAFMAYYVVGHSSSEGPMRAAEMGLHHWTDHLWFYVHSVLGRQTGEWFWGLTAAILILAWIGGRAASRTTSLGTTSLGTADLATTEVQQANTRAPLPADLAASGLFLSCVIACTYIILTVDVAKSPVVGGQFVALLLPLLWTATQALDQRRGVGRVALLQTLAFAVVFALGHVAFARPHMRASWLATPPVETRAFMGVADDIADVSAYIGEPRPVLSFDELTDFFHVSVFKVLAFERRGVRIEPRPGLGQIRVGLGEVPLEEAKQQVRSSDFALIGIDRAPNDPAPAFPLNRSLRRLAPALYAEAARTLVPVRDVTFFGRRVTFFMKPAIGCDPNSQDWVVQKDGLKCRTFAAALLRRPLIRLRGTGPFNFVGGVPNARAVVLADQGVVGKIPCEMRLEPAQNGWLQPYELTCDARGLTIDEKARLTLQIDFDRAFIPKDHGVNPDPRPLVMRRPETAELQAADAPAAIEAPKAAVRSR